MQDSHRSSWHLDAGFSLVELMVAIAVASILGVAIVFTFSTSSRHFTEQNVAALLQQDIRATLAIISRQIRMAGYDPQQTDNFSIEQADAFRFKYSADLDEDGIKDPSSDFNTSEITTFAYAAGSTSVQLISSEATSASQLDTLIGGIGSNVQVLALDFEYRDLSDTVTTNPLDVRSVIMTLTAQAPAGRAGMIQRTYSQRVECRNAGI